MIYVKTNLILLATINTEYIYRLVKKTQTLDT